MKWSANDVGAGCFLVLFVLPVVVFLVVSLFGVNPFLAVIFVAGIGLFIDGRIRENRARERQRNGE